MRRDPAFNLNRLAGKVIAEGDFLDYKAIGLRSIMDISISIVNYNTQGLLAECLKSIYAALGSILSFEVIVADNHSGDDSLTLAKQQFPNIKYIENKANLGFAKATNQTIQQSSGRYVFLLNPDTAVMGEAIQRMFSYMEEHRDIGILGCKLVMPGNIIHRNCSPFPWLLLVLENPFNIFKIPYWVYQRVKLARSDYGTAQDVDWILGSALMVRRQAFEKAGLLDERFFMYTEDMELCYRMKRRGFRIRYIPDAVILHHQNVSGNKEFGLKKRLIEYISVQKLFEKYSGKLGLIAGFLAHIMGNAIKIFFYIFLMIGKWRERKRLKSQLLLWLFTLKGILKLGWNPDY